jgi:sugar transferase (PEP-CTERM/EpsH1 system associated)
MVPVNILFLAHCIPYPPNKGDKVRAYHELRFLASRHSVDLFAFANPSEQAVGLPILSNLCRRVHFEELRPVAARARAGASLLTGKPFTITYYHSQMMAKAVRAALSRNNYDAIFVYCSAMASYVEGVSSIPVFVDFVDSDASKWAQYARYVGFPMSWIYGREARKLAKFEREVARAVHLTLVSTPLEIEAIDPDGRFGVKALQNGVSPVPSHLVTVPGQVLALGKYVVFVGQMDYLPNVDAVCYFAKEILPLIRRQHSELQFVIVGRNPMRRVCKLAALPRVIVTGAVPDVQPYLDRAVAAVAPFRICQGVQNKILEALATGLPVVATSRPARAIGATADELLFVADTPEDFAQAVIRVLEDTGIRQRPGGKEFIKRHFDWEQNLEPLERWLQEAHACAQ